MKKQTRILIVLTAYLCLLLFDSCSSSDDLGCSGSNQPPFYDFQELIISPNQNEISNGESLQLSIQLNELSYLTMQNPNPSFSLGLVNKAYGCSPVPPGYDGPKFPIEKIEVTSDQDFNMNHPAEALLNELVTLKVYNETIPLSQASSDILNFYEPEYTQKIIIIDAVPDELNIEHTFTIKITKSNGEIIESSISGIVWK